MTPDEDSLAARLLAKPVGPEIPMRQAGDKDFTSKFEIRGNTLTGEINAPLGLVNEGTALDYLEEEGLDPLEWEATHFRKIKYGQGMESVKFSYKRISYLDTVRPPLDELFALIKDHKPTPHRPQGDYGAIVALGDMQFGKVDGDGVAGTIERTIACLDAAADRIEAHRQRFSIGHIHVAWLGDHIEGFVSQGGANVHRTVLTLNEQIRMTRRVMTHALKLFAPMAEHVSMVAVPGNHGEPQRFAGKGVTTYDDSHDTESLIAVADATELNPEAFGHVEFRVPDTDEMTVLYPVAGTTVAHAHGHQWRPNKHIDWWKGQAFSNGGLAVADLLLAGHLHHFFVDTDGPRTFLQVPSLESESTWYRHSTGSVGNPGLVLAITRNRKTNLLELVNA